MVDAIDKLTENPLNYWFSFVSDSAAALFFLVWGVLHYSDMPSTIIAALAGFMAFGFLEYGTHRWFFHGKWSPAYKKHMLHHDKPTALLALPWFVSTLIAFALWFLLTSFFNAASFFVAALTLGYVYYGLMHHIQHHYSLEKKLFLKSWAFHNIHHKLPDTNYGVTTTLWDRLFGTHYQKKRAQRS